MCVCRLFLKTSTSAVRWTNYAATVIAPTRSEASCAPAATATNWTRTEPCAQVGHGAGCFWKQWNNFSSILKMSTSVLKVDSCAELVTATMTLGPTTASVQMDTCYCLMEVSGYCLCCYFIYRKKLGVKNFKSIISKYISLSLRVKFRLF